MMAMKKAAALAFFLLVVCALPACGNQREEIETVVPYTENFDELKDVNHEEIDQNVLPELKESNLDIAVYDTALAEEIKGYFPLTISAVGYGGREYYGGVDFYPEHPDLSVDVIPIGQVTSDLSVFDSLDSREDITFSLAQ